MATVLDFDEIRRMARSIYEEVRNEPLKVQKKRMRDWMDELLIDAYIAGLTGTGLPIKPVMDPARAKAVIQKKIGGETYVNRLYKHIENGDAGRIETLAESEAHRVSETGGSDAARQTEKAIKQGRVKGNMVMKRWVTMDDDRVRETHEYLHDMMVPYGARFYTFDGDSAEYPGDFSDPANNVNCRCTVDYRIN